MILKLGKELTAMVEDEARNRGMPATTFGRLILNQFFMEISNEKAKKVRKMQGGKLLAGLETAIRAADASK